MKTYAMRNLKQFTRATVAFMGLLTTMAVMNPSFAESGDRVGNGGNWSEAELAGEQAILEQTIGKINLFFLKNEKLQASFPEFKVTDLLGEIKTVDVQVVNDEVHDRHGIKRTCVNDANFIRCDMDELQKAHANPQTLFVLMLHELLGLVGVEETSPKDVNFIDGYKISKRIAPFVAKTSNYDLEYKDVNAKDPKEAMAIRLNKIVAQIRDLFANNPGIKDAFAGMNVEEFIDRARKTRVYVKPGVDYDDRDCYISTTSDIVCGLYEMEQLRDDPAKTFEVIFRSILKQLKDYRGNWSSKEILIYVDHSKEFTLTYRNLKRDRIVNNEGDWYTHAILKSFIGRAGLFERVRERSMTVCEREGGLKCQLEGKPRIGKCKVVANPNASYNAFITHHRICNVFQPYSYYETKEAATERMYKEAYKSYEAWIKNEERVRQEEGTGN